MCSTSQRYKYYVALRLKLAGSRGIVPLLIRKPEQLKSYTKMYPPSYIVHI